MIGFFKSENGIISKTAALFAPEQQRRGLLVRSARAYWLLRQQHLCAV
jgi:hypothetical protein